jgi:hypothetical protein
MRKGEATLVVLGLIQYVTLPAMSLCDSADRMTSVDAAVPQCSEKSSPLVHIDWALARDEYFYLYVSLKSIQM